MSYFDDEQRRRIQACARAEAKRSEWSFIHAVIMFAFDEANSDLVADMEYRPSGRKSRYKRDGEYHGIVLINEFAELLEIALAERKAALAAGTEKQ